MDLVVFTQATFMLGFVAMAAGSLYFLLERGQVKPEHRTTATYAAVVTFISAIFYWQMKEIVSFPGVTNLAAIESAMPLRYFDWLLTTPVILLNFGVIAALAGAKKGFTYRLVLASLLMIITGYFGEIGVPGSGGNYVNFTISSMAWIYIAFTIWTYKPTKGTALVKKTVDTLKKFIVFGWIIYPIGTAIREFLSLSGSEQQEIEIAICAITIVYLIADVANKVGFGVMTIRAVRKS